MYQNMYTYLWNIMSVYWGSPKHSMANISQAKTGRAPVHVEELDAAVEEDHFPAGHAAQHPQT